MRKFSFAICSILLVLVVSIAVLVSSCASARCTIEVNATLDGFPWTGAVNYTLIGPTSNATGTFVSANFTVGVGNWTCAYVSGGPGTFVNIIDSPTQEVSAGGTTTFTLNFVTPVPVDASVTFKTWSINGTPVPGGMTYWITPGTIIDAEYTEHVSGNVTGSVVTVHQTSWLAIHNTGIDESGEGPSMWLRCVNAPGAVTMDPPAGKSNQQCTVEENSVDPDDEIELDVCEPVNLDVEVDWELKVCTTYTKTINWIGYPSPADILFDATVVAPSQTVTLTSWACVEVGVGFTDTKPGNDCSVLSSPITIGFLPPP